VVRPAASATTERPTSNDFSRMTKRLPRRRELKVMKEERDER
jgi:hypothetical protein